MSKKLISADEARSNSENFDLSSEQIFDKISQSILANSKAGAREITVSFRKNVASNSEIEKAVTIIRESGYQVESRVLEDFIYIKVTW